MFDLDAYLARIALKERPLADAEGLATLQRAHRLAIPFENLDVILGRGIRIDSDAVFAKLVTARRGGYCFEHNRLFLDALAALGFDARPLLARVWLGVTETPPLTHTFSLVVIDGQDWIADPGFGGSYSPIMPLVEGAVADASDGASFRLERDAIHGWMLSRDGHPGSTDGRGTGSGFQPQYSFTLGQVWDADLALSNRWTSAAPESRFMQLRIASIVLPRGMASLTDRRYSQRADEVEMVAEIADAHVYRQRLSLMFGIDLSAEDVAALGLFG
ncbi:MAG: acetyltransferase [Sphingomonas bacterium]|uniref:arylamine N-acetyltransferase family protein n=1 Tax=Sphingomonas bacterium TaxID=1895847 RepID=UPI00261307B5|nr:arylamine N-acetyltransferase [Sphingomonas bacterium]MDB5704467.1 acetyltransferase [Sphingomonas bacterium]